MPRSKFSFKNICALNCLNKSERELNELINAVKTKNAKEIHLPFKDENYEITYAPVGNYAEEPFVIISGKTTSGGSSDIFKNSLCAGEPLLSACVKSIYSNMKNNLFKYLNKIKLFDLLKKHSDYWQINDYETQWNKIFESPVESLKSRIQVTQAFNCAILNKVRKDRSAQPKKSLVKRIQREIGCMFSHFNITPSLKLIIFLDTPFSSSSYHQFCFWKDIRGDNHEFEIISITHPSAQNSVVYNNLDDLTKIKGNKKENAIKLFEEARLKVEELTTES